MLPLLLLALLLVLGCADGTDPPKLVLDTQPSCEEQAMACAAQEPALIEVEGVRVLHQRVVGHPLVTLQIKFDAPAKPSGVQLWAEKAALDIVHWAGPQRLGLTAWPAKLASLSAELGVSTGSDYASLHVTVPRPNWKAVWELLVETLETPTTDSYELEHGQRNYHASFASELDDARAASGVEVYSRLFSGHDMNALRDNQSAIGAVQESDLEEAWRAMLTRRRVLVVVLGDISVEQVSELVGRGLKGLPRHYAPRFRAGRSAPSNEGPVAVLDYPESPAWHVQAALLGPGANAPDYPALALGMAVLDERMFDQIRDAEGLAYTAGARLSFYRQSYARIWVSTPDPLAALAILRKIVVDLKSAGPSADELARAYQTLRQEQLASRATPMGLAWSLADWELTTGSYQDFDGFVTALEAATAEEVRDALQSYLRDVKIVAAGSGAALTEADLAAVFE